jgi:uncharacterized OsmC-like protein
MGQTNNPVNPGTAYAVTVTRQDESRAVVSARGHELTLNVKRGDGAAGFNAAETLLAALAACMMTNINAISQKMRLEINDARIAFTAVPHLAKVRHGD